MTIPMPDYTWSPKDCKKTIKYKLQVSDLDGKVLTELPKFAQFDAEKLILKLSGDKTSFSERDRTYNFLLVASTDDDKHINTDYKFNIKTLFFNTPPTVNGNFVD